VIDERLQNSLNHAGTLAHRFWEAHEAATLRPRSKAAKEFPQASTAYVQYLETCLIDAVEKLASVQIRRALRGQ
jgi:hypothetical protein